MPHVSKIPFLFVSSVFMFFFVYWLVVGWYSKKKEIFSISTSKVGFSLSWPFI